jgi:hypothetical protein
MEDENLSPTKRKGIRFDDRREAERAKLSSTSSPLHQACQRATV